ncbi:unnamed protein product [Anisakis simplex]|uniref:Integrase core domain containing protein n=1 Tax=Anisakis simplex TaxID=6269 RepID=A0A0M3K3V2_ANISI|nr:unnamed protein product [Anisakis simplex]
MKKPSDVPQHERKQDSEGQVAVTVKEKSTVGQGKTRAEVDTLKNEQLSQPTVIAASHDVKPKNSVTRTKPNVTKTTESPMKKRQRYPELTRVDQMLTHLRSLVNDLRREIGLELDYDDVHGGLKRVAPIAQSVNDVSSGKPKKQRSNATTSVSTTTRKYDSLKLDGGEDESDYDYYDTEDEIQAIINRLRRERMKFATEEASDPFQPQLAGVRRDLSRLLLRLRRSSAGNGWKR